MCFILLLPEHKISEYLCMCNMETYRPFVCCSFYLSLSLSQISRQKGAEYAQEVDAIFMETSALNATNVEEIFVQISKSRNQRDRPFDLIHKFSCFLRSEVASIHHHSLSLSRWPVCAQKRLQPPKILCLWK